MSRHTGHTPMAVSALYSTTTPASVATLCAGWGRCDFQAGDPIPLPLRSRALLSCRILLLYPAHYTGRASPRWLEEAFNAASWRGQRTRFRRLHGDDEIPHHRIPSPLPATAFRQTPAEDFKRRMPLAQVPAQLCRPARAAAGLARSHRGGAVVWMCARRGIRCPDVASPCSLLIPSRTGGRDR